MSLAGLTEIVDAENSNDLGIVEAPLQTFDTRVPSPRVAIEGRKDMLLHRTIQPLKARHPCGRIQRGAP